jgi:hypothetical protein
MMVEVQIDQPSRLKARKSSEKGVTVEAVPTRLSVDF